MAGLNWLHLSDWHQKGNEFDRVVLRDALIKDIKERINISPDLAKIDFIIFSGDVAYSGKPDEYQAAKEELFDPLLEATSLSPDKLFIVPGNHDLDRNKFDLLPAPLTRPLKSPEDIQVWLCDSEKRKRLSDPFMAFSSFVSSYTGQKDPAYANIRRMEINGRKIALLGINSSWMCGRKQDDRGLVLIGEPQIHDSLNTISDADIKIAVIHHPFDWLSDFDRNKVESRLMKGCDFILRGHQHDPQVKVIRSTLGDCIVIPAGTSYDRRLPPDLRYANAYNFVHLDLDIENIIRGVVYLHRWSDKRNEWIADEDSIKGGKFEFEMIGKNYVSHDSTKGGKFGFEMIGKNYVSHVFICYSRKDEQFVIKLATNLKDRGVPVWLDLWDISSGVDWDQAIDEALCGCDHLLIILSPASVNSDNVRSELQMAFEEKKHIVPVLYQPCRIPRRLRLIQHTDLSNCGPDNPDALEKIFRALNINRINHK